MVVLGWLSWLIIAVIILVCVRLRLPKIGMGLSVSVMAVGLTCSVLAGLAPRSRAGLREAVLVSLSLAVWACMGMLTLRVLGILPR